MSLRARIERLERARAQSDARIAAFMAAVLAGGPVDGPAAALTEAELDSVLAHCLARLDEIEPGAAAALVAQVEAEGINGES